MIWNATFLAKRRCLVPGAVLQGGRKNDFFRIVSGCRRSSLSRGDSRTFGALPGPLWGLIVALSVLATAGCSEGHRGADPGQVSGAEVRRLPLPPASVATLVPPSSVRFAGNSNPPPTTQASVERDWGPFQFCEVAGEAGIDFIHVSGMTAAKHVPTANGSGVAIFDSDGDNRMDLYFATGTFLPLGSQAGPPNRFYRNLGGGRFRDETEASGLGFAGYCHGVVAGDLDNDGDQDLFLANYGPDVLFLNLGGGRFQDISRSAGVDRFAWSSGAALLDYDNDGDLDIYVACYGDWRLPDDDRYCGEPTRNVRLYCVPKEIRTARHILYRNNGNLTFTDVTEAAGLGRIDGHGFAAVASDLNNDGQIDLYVANDQDPNFLYLNRGDGTFEDASLSSGAAGDERGHALGSMGVEAQDLDGDGLPELFATNFENEPNTLWQNLGRGLFLDATARYGLKRDSLPLVGWGCALADFDRDGWLDLFVANGHIDDNRHLLGQDSPYHEPPLLYRSLGTRRFLRVAAAGPYFQAHHVGRGVAAGDLDDDGDLDLVVNHKDGPPALLRNDTQNTNHWIRIRLVGTLSNRDAIGARVEIDTGDRTIHRQRTSGGSLMSSHDPRLLVGLGHAQGIRQITVRWPSGQLSVLENLEPNQDLEIRETPQ